MPSRPSSNATSAAMRWRLSRQAATITRHECELSKKENEVTIMDRALMNYKSPERSHLEKSLRRTSTPSLSALGVAREALKIRISCEKSCCRSTRARDSPGISSLAQAQEEIFMSMTICRMTSATVAKASCAIVIGNESAVLATIRAKRPQVSSTSSSISSRMSS